MLRTKEERLKNTGHTRKESTSKSSKEKIVTRERKEPQKGC